MGRYIPRERKEVALQMSVLGVRDRTIHRYTGISEQSMRYLRKTFREHRRWVNHAACCGSECLQVLHRNSALANS